VSACPAPFSSNPDFSTALVPCRLSQARDPAALTFTPISRYTPCAEAIAQADRSGSPASPCRAEA